MLSSTIRPNKLDLSYTGLDEFKEPEFKGHGPKNSKKESNVGCEKESDNSKENSNKSLVKEQESQVKSSFVEGCGKTVIPTAAKIEKPVKKSVRYAEMYRSQRPRGNQRNWNDQRNWNGQKSNQLDNVYNGEPKKLLMMLKSQDEDEAFSIWTHEEKSYVTQPPGFKDPDHPDKVYKVVKALYGLHQAPRAWYETLANYLLSNGFNRGKIDQTLFIKKQKGDILLVQVYVDDIIFGSTNKELCTGFEKLMKDKFQMSSMGELTFFLGLQVQQKEDGIFISQDKYVAEILKKFNYSDVKSASTPVDLEKKPFHVTPKTSHLLAVKRIFRYLKGKPTLGLWYSRDSPFELDAYTDSDYAGATLDREVQQLEVCQFLGKQVDHSYGSEKANCGSDLQKEKYAQAKENAAFEKEIQRRVDSSKDQESLGVPEDASKQGRSIADIDVDVKQLTTKSPRDRGWLFRSQEKDQIALDEQIARDIQAKLDVELLEEQKLVRKQEEEANIVLIESWENTQAIMEADRLLAERLKSKEREELTDEEKAKLLWEMKEKIRKHFACNLTDGSSAEILFNDKDATKE
ncbi:putative ribonuclease H-like domain-containing protein [Tanacetum coccineum]